LSTIFVDFIFVDFDKILDKIIYFFGIFLRNYFLPTLPFWYSTLEYYCLFFSYANFLVWKMFLKKYPPWPHMPLIGSIPSSAFETKLNKKMQVREVPSNPLIAHLAKEALTDGAT
jgi:hypothetical protein